MTRARFKLEIDCENAAFEEYPHSELRLILRRLSDVVYERGIEPGEAARGVLRDTNGNNVGSWQYEPSTRPEADAEYVVKWRKGDYVGGTFPPFANKKAAETFGAAWLKEQEDLRGDDTRVYSYEVAESEGDD